jgi:hypothetical protein
MPLVRLNDSAFEWMASISACGMAGRPGGYGSGRGGGRPTVESAFRIDIDALRRDGLIRLGVRGGCVIRFSGPYCDLDVECETHIDGAGNDWVRLKYEMTDYWTDGPFEIDDKIFVATSRPPFGGLRWWFVCPHLNRRARKLYLPLGGRQFWSRRAYELAYASQRETKFDRALRRGRKLRLRLGGDPDDDEYPDKPPRMRWATYSRLMDRLVAADGVTEKRLKAARLLWATA